MIFTHEDQDEVSKSGEYQETVKSIVPEIKIAYGYENSSDIGLVTQQVGEAKQQLLKAKESEKRAKEAARLRAELKRKLEKEADENVKRSLNQILSTKANLKIRLMQLLLNMRR